MPIDPVLSPRSLRSRTGPPAPLDVAVLIPAYQPTSELEPLIVRLLDSGTPAVLLIDDGNTVARGPLFASLALQPRVHLLRHPQNLGKGAALKTGIRYFLEHLRHYKGLVTADADGQHAWEDIVRAARALHASPQLAIIGARNFGIASAAQVPLRNVMGNRVTAFLFRALTSIPLADAQTGLRALPTPLLSELLALPGSRYEFEMSVLLHIARTRHPLAQQHIRTLYDPGNPTSHFRPFADSFRVLAALIARHPKALPARAMLEPADSADYHGQTRPAAMPVRTT